MPVLHSRSTMLARLLAVAGGVEIAVGFAHFAMPGFYRHSAGIDELVGAEGDFVRLVTFAVGILLIAFGVITLVFARRSHDHLELLVPYLMIKSSLWAARLVLEILYPVRLDMFGVDPFTAVVMPGVAIEFGIFVAATWVAQRARTTRPGRQQVPLINETLI